MMRILYILILSCLVLSCSNKKPEYKYRTTIVKSKTIDIYQGNTRYNIAYTNGQSDAFSFGLYSKYGVGDTIYWRTYKGWKDWQPIRRDVYYKANSFK